MFSKIADNRDSSSMAMQFRRRRFALFQSLLAQVERPVHILDIGGTEDYWKMMNLDDDQVFITLLNLQQENIAISNITSIAGDARDIKVEDQSFDIVFSNSVIEHVGTFDDQSRMANEVRRVGERFFVQTPNRYFPLEPHFLFPLFQFLPVNLRVWMLQHFDLGWFAREPDRVKAGEIVKSIRLLNKTELSALFPMAAIYEEKILGLTKSFVVYGGWDN